MPVIYLICRSPCNSSILPSIVLKLGRAALKQRFTWTCSSWTAKQSDHPPAGSLLHYLLTLTINKDGGHSLLPTSTVTNSFYFRKQDALCCPDFPLASIADASDRAGTLPYQNAKIMENMEKPKYFNDNLNLAKKRDSIKRLKKVIVWT